MVQSWETQWLEPEDDDCGEKDDGLGRRIFIALDKTDHSLQ